ncbi:hypothetical protein PCASD_08325 [Puccinia coronata f. sp. avenae]|nr:hypothetical protein PCASD_08325 [Puccinia coronata f. sp. avenae]
MHCGNIQQNIWIRDSSAVENREHSPIQSGLPAAMTLSSGRSSNKLHLRWGNIQIAHPSTYPNLFSFGVFCRIISADQGGSEKTSVGHDCVTHKHDKNGENCGKRKMTERSCCMKQSHEETPESNITS